jgi:hypothetical protein
MHRSPVAAMPPRAHALFFIICVTGRRRLARCRNTDDTNRGYSDTRTIRWLARIARSETFQMFIDWPPKRRPPSEWWHETVPTGMRPPRMRIVTACSGAAAVSTIRPVTDPAVQRSRLETDHEPAIMGSPRPSFTRLRRSQSMHGSCSSVTRLLLVRLIFRFKSLVADRSCRHGYAP